MSFEGPEETKEEMNARLVEHVRKLQTELRKYKHRYDDAQARVEKLERRVRKMRKEAHQQVFVSSLFCAFHIAIFSFPIVIAAAIQTSPRGREPQKAAQQELDSLRDQSEGFRACMHFMVGPKQKPEIDKPVELHDTHVCKVGYLKKRGTNILSSSGVFVDETLFFSLLLLLQGTSLRAGNGVWLCSSTIRGFGTTVRRNDPTLEARSTCQLVRVYAEDPPRMPQQQHPGCLN